MARAAVIVTLRPGDAFRVRKHPATDRAWSKPEVWVDLVNADQGAVWVTVTDPATFDGLLAALAQARDWLFTELASTQTPLPLDPDPVGDTGLTLQPLPVGVV